MVFEGIEGAGKSTLVRAIAHRCEVFGRPSLVVREPGGTPVGDRLRDLFVASATEMTGTAEAFVLNAARAQLVESVIEPAISTGRTVLCDRFTLSTLAYQGYGRGVDVAALRALAAIATGGLAADLTLLVDVPVEVSQARVEARARAGTCADRIELEPDDFHERVRAGYLALAREDERVRVLDGRDSPEGLAEAAWSLIAPLFA